MWDEKGLVYSKEKYIEETLGHPGLTFVVIPAAYRSPIRYCQMDQNYKQDTEVISTKNK